MKLKIQFFIGLLLVSVVAFGQLQFKGRIDSKEKIFQLDDGSLKYIKYDRKSDKVSIFNIDNTIWRIVKIPLPKYHILDEIKHISINTINDDDLVEVIYSCVIYDLMNDENIMEDGPSLFEFTINIINERSEMILKVPNSNEIELFETGEKKTLLIYRHLGKGFGGVDEKLVYSLK